MRKKEEEEEGMSSRIFILIAHSRLGFDVADHESLMMHMKQCLMWKMMSMRMRMMLLAIEFLRIRIEILHSMIFVDIAIQIHGMCLHLRKEKKRQDF